MVGQTGGFQGLINALDKTGQTGALAILKQYKPGPLVSQPLVPQSAGTISESEIMKSADSVQVGGPGKFFEVKPTYNSFRFRIISDCIYLAKLVYF